MKLSLRALLLWVAFAGLMTAALVQPSLFWMRISFTLAVSFLLLAVAGVVLTREKARVFWIGAALFGGAYFLLMNDSSESGPLVRSSNVLRGLITQHLLDAIARARGMSVGSESHGFHLWNESMFYEQLPVWSSGSTMSDGSMSGGMGSGAGMEGGGGMGGPAIDPAMGAPGMPGGAGGVDPALFAQFGGGMPMSRPAGWSSTAYSYFVFTGHSLFVILVSLAGGAVVRAMFVRGVAPAE